MSIPLQRNHLSAALWAVAALAFGPVVAPVAAQQQPSGAEVWSNNCGRCHRMRAVDAYNASQWESVVTHMALTARLTSDETRAVREFLVGAARARQAAQAAASTSRDRGESARPGLLLGAADGCCDPEVGKAIYKAQCVVCHGQKGQGDGPAAVALNPRPSVITQAARVGKLPDDSLVLIVTTGRGGMPGFGKILTPDQVLEVIAHLRTLKP
jgi:mono/diheme cytochrome c family protein